MIRPIVHDPMFLAQKSVLATEADRQIIQDLLDTLRANLDRCVGMAANMIGEKKRIIAFCMDSMQIAMVNPEIIEQSGEYEAEESCLSLAGSRKAKRYQRITVKYQDVLFMPRKRTFGGFPAQIIQHEIDPCNGVLI